MQAQDLISFTFWLILSAALVKLQMEEKDSAGSAEGFGSENRSLRRTPAAEYREHMRIANTLY